jgi:hypothetical protein
LAGLIALFVTWAFTVEHEARFDWAYIAAVRANLKAGRSERHIQICCSGSELTIVYYISKECPSRGSIL